MATEIPPCKTENLVKATWKISSDTKMLLDICTSEIRKCGKPGIAFKNKKWEILTLNTIENPVFPSFYNNMYSIHIIL